MNRKKHFFDLYIFEIDNILLSKIMNIIIKIKLNCIIINKIEIN